MSGNSNPITRNMAAYDDVSSPLPTIITNIQLREIISQGAHGRVLEAKWNGSLVAVKQIHTIFEKVSPQECEILRRKVLMECDRSNRIQHPNFVRIFGVYFFPGIGIPSLVMERLHCSLSDLLERNPVISLDVKMSVLHQIGLGLRYLHTYGPPIIHRGLSSRKILISKGMEVKIAYLSTIQFLDAMQNFSMSSSAQDFMAPEVLGDAMYGKEQDIFSLGCIMLHTLSHQWPCPSQNVVAGAVEHTLDVQSEIKRRFQYLDKIHKKVRDTAIPLIVNCLKNLPSDRPTIIEVCDLLETLVVKINRDQSIPENLVQAQRMLQDVKSQMKRQLHRKDAEIEALRSDMTKLQFMEQVDIVLTFLLD